MKKAYTKPNLHIEYFSLSQSIAAGCGGSDSSNGWGEPMMAYKSTCGWAWPDGLVAFLNEMDVCTDKYFATDDVDGICYNNPEGGFVIYGS